MSEAAAPAGDIPPFRYTAAMADEIERRWQDTWEREGTFHAPNPTGPLADPGHPRAGAEKLYVLDMFPYPSGAGLHVGHPLGYIGTDCFARYQRMAGRNVLHAMGFDAFGLPAEQYAVQTGTHPRTTTVANIERYKAQLRRLGLAHDDRRSVATIDTDFYRWTQWIFLQVFNSWYDADARRARPIAELTAAFAAGDRPTPDGRAWAELSPAEQRRIVDDHRLAYVSQAPVNWCPGLGTVLANEEVTADGRSDRGNFPVFKRNLKQWMMRITAYGDRLLDDLDTLDWPESIKLQQRNWIGRSTGAHIDFATGTTDSGEARIRVFTTRPDTIFGATYLVLAPEHELVDALTPAAWPAGTRDAWTGGHAGPREAVEAYRKAAAAKTDVERQADTKEKTGVFVGAYATHPVTGGQIPIFIADYVLAGYGTGAIMAVPAQDERDWAFAEVFELPIVRTVQPVDGFDGKAYTGDGPAINSAAPERGLDLNGLGVADAKAATIAWLEANGHGVGAVTWRLRDWLFSRQRYWGEPFPIVYDATGAAIALPEEMLPVELPEVDDFSPKTFDPDDADSNPETPLSRRRDWVEVELDLGDGPQRYTRETNVMPQWAGSCWYELRYLDPTNSGRFVDPENEAYWMGPRAEGDCGGTDLYVGGAEHAVLHLLYARFWHKVLYDLGHVSSFEPFRKLFNQGMIQAYAFRDSRGTPVPAEEVVEVDGRWMHGEQEVTREYGKMGKSLRNVVTPDDMCAAYGADTFRVYEMSMGPLEVSRPWETRAVVGSYRFLQRVWRAVVDEQTGTLRVTDAPADTETRRLLHRVIDGVRTDMEGIRFNTAIAKLIELTNAVTRLEQTPREVAEPLVLMLAPFAPHVAEELWRMLGHDTSLAYADFPTADPALLVAETVTYPVQVNGKVRGRVEVPADAPQEVVRAAALEAVASALAGKEPRKVIVVPGRLVSVVA
ncbi:leucine--tRNA ligase [Micromonospora sp. NPDC049257]|uniref:leucine--tRNA ligase n=1 Tax=Micromonospora sp. NPDC049257 TaxID=3155771 RepID=UPI00343A5FA6